VRRALTVSFIVITVLGLLVRVPSIAEPLGIDQGLLASVAKGLSRGEVLYRDIWDQKPPGLYVAYLAAFTVFGWRTSSVYWMDIAASAITALLILAIVRRLTSASVAWLAAGLFTALTIPSWLFNHGGFLERLVAETVIPIWVGLAAWCAVRYVQRPSLVTAGALGFWIGIAIVFKPNAALYGPAIVLWLAIYGTHTWGRLTLAAVVAGLCSLIVPALTVAWLARLGVLAEARIALIDFNRAYVANGFAPGRYALEFSRLAWLHIRSEPLWAAGAIGSLLAIQDLLRMRRLEPLPALAIVWGAAAALVIVANGARLFNTYFLQALAPLSILAAWTFAGLERRDVVHKAVAAAAVVISAWLLVGHQYVPTVYAFARADADRLLGRVDPATYLDAFGGYANNRGYSARANEELFEYIRAHTTHGDTIYQFGINAAGVYFATDRLNAQRFLRVNEFVQSDFADPRFQLPAVTAELAARRPVYLIFERLHSATFGDAVDRLPEQPDVARLLEAYRLETQIEDFAVYRRRD
jgi:Dolichyl-phosphate-mannose-protein mannosyltransferase